MSIYTNTGLVKHAEMALALKTKYMWAGTLYPITDAYITNKVEQCRKAGVSPATSGYTDARVKALRELAGKGYYGVDCVCLVKSYIWSGNPDGGVKSPAYNGATDVNSVTMYNRATVKGKIKDLPEIPGLILYDSRSHHVGIYIGRGQTIESTLGSRGDGVVKRTLDNLWTDWFECPYIDYPAQEQLQAVTLAFKAAIRSEPKYSSAKLGELAAGSKCVIVKDSDTKDSKTGYVYVKLAGDKSQWIIKSAIK